MTGPVSWWRSDRDQRVHAWAGEYWAGDEIALCQHACPPLHVLCDQRGPRCSACTRAVGGRGVGRAWCACR